MDQLPQLILECANRNRLAQEQLYKKFYPALFLLCKRFFGNDHEALECLHDGMLKVYKKIGEFKNEKGHFFNWIYTIILHTALDKIKRSNVTSSIEVTENLELVPEENLLEALEWKDIYKLLDVLPPATRIVCTLYYIEGFTIKEICNKLALSAGTIKWHLSESRSRLKPVFKNYYH